MEEKPLSEKGRSSGKWLNRVVLGIGLTSLFSDWSHEMATTVLPMFLATVGGAAGWLGAIEGIADGVSAIAKLYGGYITDRVRSRKRLAVFGYLTTAFATASMGFATRAWHLLVARVIGWFGRGIRGPARKSLLADGVSPEAYGRAFGVERMMDTLGAIVGPLTVFWLLQGLQLEPRQVFFIAFLPGLLAAGSILLLVQEKTRTRKIAQRPTFWGQLKRLPLRFRRFLLGVGIFGLGDCSHTMLILLAVEMLGGDARARALATGLYLWHNVVYAGSAVLWGYWADRSRKNYVLAASYLLGALMAVSLWILPPGLLLLGVIFVLGGLYVGGEETLEDSFCAELIPTEQRGMAYGVLAAVNALGDFASSIVVGILWQAFGIQVAFAYCGTLFLVGALLVAFGTSSKGPVTLSGRQSP